ncbi:MAG: hypothetical protein ABJO01_00850 [Parasphingorhabdus sp.]|uniref:DUF6975 family protein n=1 Tax=Parasphingorhabdus sp. TaxID=2709688 RepID=UPI003297CF42
MPETNLIPSTRPSLLDHVSSHGTQSASYMQLIRDDFSTLSGIDIADIAHFLCVLHGRHPGVVDHAANKTADMEAREWLVEAMDGFSAERAFLTKLTVAAGPISGVRAEDQSNATVLAQRKALEMLSQSDRNGCALGASFALVLDWQAIRPLLEKIAIKLSVEPRELTLPSSQATISLNAELAQSSAVERAINFGVDQILTQHRGLWQLLEARRNARNAG